MEGLKRSLAPGRNPRSFGIPFDLRALRITWSARLEIARLLEAGVPAREILRSIKSGEEGEDPLESAASPDASTPRSTSAGVKRPLEVGSTSSSARASSAPRLNSPRWEQSRIAGMGWIVVVDLGVFEEGYEAKDIRRRARIFYP